MSSLDHEQLKQVVANAEARLAALRKKYPKLGAHLVLFQRGEQTSIRSSGSEILQDSPNMVIHNPAKAALMEHLKKKPKKEAADSVHEAWKDELENLEQQLSYHADARVELRFHNLNYELIGKLQKDPLVDQELTPQTAASIRIVLGNLHSLLQA